MRLDPIFSKRCCKCRVWVEFRCIEFVATGWGTGKWSKIYQTITNLTSGDMGISLLVIQLGVTGLKKIRLIYLLGLFQGRGEKGQGNLVCVEHHWVIGLMVVMLMSYSHVVSVVLVHLVLF